MQQVAVRRMDSRARGIRQPTPCGRRFKCGNNLIHARHIQGNGDWGALRNGIGLGPTVVQPPAAGSLIAAPPAMAAGNSPSARRGPVECPPRRLRMDEAGNAGQRFEVLVAPDSHEHFSPSSVPRQRYRRLIHPRGMQPVFFHRPPVSSIMSLRSAEIMAQSRPGQLRMKMTEQVAAGGRFCLRLFLAAALGMLAETAQAAPVTITKTSNTDWSISNGLISFVFDPVR